ncbi:MAG: ATPase AAA [Melioribacteraceae bacterium]|nr:MAG: ATPase AAA [Melioribacteraceae bacterium]
MEIVLEAIEELVDYELAVVLSYDDDKNLKVRRARGPLVSNRLKDFVLSLDKHTNIKEILSKGQVYLFDDDPEDGDVHIDTYDEIIDMPAGHSCLVAPLKIEDTTLGMLTLDHRECDMFTPQIVKTTATLSRLISLALAQSLAADSLRVEKEALLLERNNLLSEMPNELKNMIGSSKSWLRALEKIKLAAPSDITVMINGETGTGKEKAARAIHSLSHRSNRPFVALNCTTLTASLAESELFGHEKGAFTGAVSQRKGRFEIANTGTLFLDEIGDMPLEVQPKLLRALQEGTFERVGGEKQIQADVRIVCATNKDLEKAVKDGEFREDLYYRLNVFPVVLPPLRERENDVLLLADFFLGEIARKRGLDKFKITSEAAAYLRENPWKGNVRELQNTLERATVLSGNSYIELVHLLPPERKNSSKKSGIANHTETLDETIANHIKKVLEVTDGKIYGEDGAAKLLGLKPTTLQSKMKKLGIK